MRSATKYFVVLFSLAGSAFAQVGPMEHSSPNLEKNEAMVQSLPTDVLSPKTPCTPVMLANAALHLEQIVDKLFEMCRDADGAFVSDKVLRDESGQEISCESEKTRAHSIQAQVLEMQETGMCPAACALCVAPVSAHDELSKFLEKMDEEKECTELEKIDRAPKKCLGDILKTAFMAMPIAGPSAALVSGAKMAMSGNPFSMKERAGNDRCEVEFLNGIVQNLFETVKGISDLGKMAFEASTNKVKSWWTAWTTTEDKLAEAAHLAASEEDSFLDRLKQDPKAVIGELATAIWHMGNNWIMNNFGCEEWSGLPHASQCLKPMESWKCASCKQMTQAFCAIGGVLTSEVILSYAMGAGLAKGMTLTIATSQKMNAAMAKGAPALHQALKSGAQYGSKAVKASAQFSKAGWNSFVASKAARAVLGDPRVLGARVAAQDFKNIYSVASSSKSAHIAASTAKFVTYPIRSYLKLLDDAGRCGIEVGSKPWLFKNKLPQAQAE